MDITVKPQQATHTPPNLRGSAAVRAIFDADYYLRTNPDVAAASADPLQHFLDTGWAEGRKPHPLFDTDHYIDSNADIAQAGINPLIHYVASGAREGRNPSPLFHSAWYRDTHADVGEANPLAHYIHVGAFARRNPNPLFDADWYVRQYPEAAANPLAHYLEHRARTQPHPLFDPAYYLAQNPDVAEAGIDPLAHYLLRGHLEQRRPHPDFDAVWYVQKYPDVAQAKMNPLLHYVIAGKNEGRERMPSEVKSATILAANRTTQIHELICERWYRGQYGHLLADGESCLAHYMRIGQGIGCNPNPFFDPVWYREKNRDLRGTEPFAHYLLRGWREGRWPSPFVDELWCREKLRVDPKKPAVASLYEAYVADRHLKMPKTAELIRGDMTSVVSLSSRIESLRHTKRHRRIGFFTHDLLWQGAQNSLFELASSKRHSGIYEAIALSFLDGPLIREYQAAGIPLIVLPMRMYDASLEALAHVFRGLKLDIIHANTTRCYEAVAAAQVAGIRSIWNIRESDPFDAAFSFVNREQQEFIYKEVIPATDHFIFVAHSTSALWPERVTRSRSTIPNGIDETRFLPRAYDTEILDKCTSTRRNFLCVGTFTPRKDQMSIAAALEELPDPILERMRFTFVGAVESEYSKDVTERLRGIASTRPIEIDIHPHTSTIEQRGRVLEQYSKAHCFVQASLNESYPRVVLEALTAGCDVIASNSFGTAEILGSDSGCLFEPGNSKQLAALLLSYVQGNVRQAVKTAPHSYQDMIKKYDAVYASLVRS